MNRYFTIMVVPDREKGVKSFRIPRVLGHGILFLSFLGLIVVSLLVYDYYKISRKIWENQHLATQNRQLKEQIQTFQSKINALTEDIDRIQIFEQKLRVMMGLEDLDQNKAQGKDGQDDDKPTKQKETVRFTTPPSLILEDDQIPAQTEFLQLKNLYEKKIATTFGLQVGYQFTKQWSDLTKESFSWAHQFALFDFKYSQIKSLLKDLEVNIHELDQTLLDKESLLASTPTLMPTNGWITSYYGPRISPTSKRLRMHEGLDIGARTGTAIVATADGKVAYAGSKPGFGKFVQIDHGYGIESFYAHARKLTVKKGEVIKRGTQVATIGNTGSSTGPHLHYEIRVNGTPVDPMFYILN